MNPVPRAKTPTRLTSVFIVIISTILGSRLQGSDWPTWGGSEQRNMVSPETNIPGDFDPGTFKEGTEDVDLTTTKNVKWVAKLGSQAYGNLTVAKGHIYLGTNNAVPRDPNHVGDRGVLQCLDEATGTFIWQLVVPKLGTGKVSDWEYLGICSSPAIEGDQVYVVTNRAEVVCLDAKGFADGNDGPFTGELKYVQVDGKPESIGPSDGDIIWTYDMREELGVFPHNIASSSILIHGDRLFVVTSNGVDWSHINIPNPNAPGLVALDKKTGALLGEETVGISQRILHSNWSSPSFGVIEGGERIFFGAGDGSLYGFDPVPVKDDEGTDILPLHLRFDGNPPEYRTRDGKPIKYATEEGPSEFIATPVFHEGKVYVAIGQDPEHGMGIGMLSCIDATKDGTWVQDQAIWSHPIDRSISTVAILDDLLFITDYTGFFYCFDKNDGTLHYKYDTKSNIWSSPFVVDGKVFVGAEDGTLTVFAASRDLKILSQIEFDAPLYSTPVAANGVLYVGTHTHLYAIASPVSEPGDGRLRP